MTVRVDIHQRKEVRAGAARGLRALAASAAAVALIAGGAVPAAAQSPDAGSIGPGSSCPGACSGYRR